MYTNEIQNDQLFTKYLIAALQNYIIVNISLLKSFRLDISEE